MPVVSVVIPCYNSFHYLGECLESIISQTYRDWEAWVVDDASTDSDVAGFVAENYPDIRIQVIRHPSNLGLGAARNTGIRCSQSQYILPVDADDKLAFDAIEKILSLLVNHPENNLAFPDFITFGNKSEIIHYHLQDHREMYRAQWIPGPGTMFVRELWEKVSGYYEGFEILGNEDWDFYLKAVETDFRPIHLPEPLYYYRMSGESLSNRMPLWYQQREYLYSYHKKYFDEYRLGNSFLVDGYIQSAKANFKIKKLSLAGQLLNKAFLSALKDKNALGQFFQALWPISWKMRAKQGKAKLKNQILPGIMMLSKAGRNLYWDYRAKELERRYGRLQHDYPTVEEIIRFVMPSAVLEIGCGGGRLFPVYHKMNIEYFVGQDISREALKIAGAKCKLTDYHLILGSIQQLNYSAHYFDLVISNRVLQHVIPAEIYKTVEKICQLGKYIYLNESEAKNSKPGSYLFIHDYPSIFSHFGYEIIKKGEIEANAGKQTWYLFALSTVMEPAS